MTKNSNYGLYAVAAAILIVGAVAFDVPLGSLAVFGLFLACPLMMIFMIISFLIKSLAGFHQLKKMSHRW